VGFGSTGAIAVVDEEEGEEEGNEKYGCQDNLEDLLVFCG
jgi:hypothetical protein